MTVGGDVVEAVVMDAGMSEVLGHIVHDMAACKGQEARVACEIEADESVAILKALRPLGPTARRVLAGDGEYRRAIGHLPAALEHDGFCGGNFERSLDRGHECLRR